LTQMTKEQIDLIASEVVNFLKTSDKNLPTSPVCLNQDPVDNASGRGVFHDLDAAIVAAKSAHHQLLHLSLEQRNLIIQLFSMVVEPIRQGGIYDHIGFGFHRYSTDGQWFLPHFEKMLYDQAMLAMAYTEAYQATGNVEYEKTACEIFTYVVRDMTAKDGGFFSAEDADSEGEEGKFYLWTQDEVKGILSQEEAELITAVFNIERDGNCSEEATGKATGKKVLFL